MMILAVPSMLKGILMDIARKQILTAHYTHRILTPGHDFFLLFLYPFHLSKIKNVTWLNM